jgi:hypothetical protein
MLLWIQIKESKMTKHEKKLLILRAQLQGAGMVHALAALEFGRTYHVKQRKGGDPEFSHQVEIALFALTLPSIREMELLICIILLHDVREDYNVSNEEIVGIFIDRAFGMRVAFSVENMTKEYRGVRKNDVDVFEALAQDEYGSLAKLCDRIHNLQTMVGVFTLVKQKEYLREVEELFLHQAHDSVPNGTDQKSSRSNGGPECLILFLHRKHQQSSLMCFVKRTNQILRFSMIGVMIFSVAQLIKTIMVYGFIQLGISFSVVYGWPNTC